MPLPNAKLATAPPARGERHLFVSYSHRDGDDADLPRRCIDALRLLAQGQPELGLASERIFFDRRNLVAGDLWDEEIQAAIRRSHLFVFLVSQQSLVSDYCMRQELKVAAELGIPIVPVLLTDCLWQDQPVPDDSAGRRLGAFDAVPKDDKGQLVPVSQWPDLDGAFRRVAEQIGRRLARDLGRTITPPAALAQRRIVPPLLPYRCNQEPQEAQFDRGLLRWRGQALLVLVRGTAEDNAPRFWERLRCKNLQDYLDELPLAALEPRPLPWPEALDDGRVRKDIALDVTCALSNALTGSRFKLQDGADLAAALAAQPGLRALYAAPRHEGAKALSASLRALLALIDSAPAEAPLQRLVLALLVEEPALLAEADLVRALRLGNPARTQIVELDPLLALDADDVRKWHLDQEIEALSGLDDERLLAQVFGSDSQLRLRRFDERVRPLLGIS